LRRWRHSVALLAASAAMVAGCADRPTSISEDGLTPQQRTGGVVSATCVVFHGQLKCWHLETLGGVNQLLLMLRDELEPPSPLPPVDLGSSGEVTAFASTTLMRSRCAALRGEGIKCWGTNGGESEPYQLGQPDPELVLGDAPDERGTGLPFVDLGATDVVSVANSQSGYCALFESGRIKCWGAGQPTLGMGDLEARGDDPSEMGDALPYVDLGTGFQAVGIAGQFKHMCAWDSEGRVKCWGYNDRGQAGQEPGDPIGDEPGEMGDALPAVELGSEFHAVQVVVGLAHSCALSKDGVVKCWGANSDLNPPEPPQYEGGPSSNHGRLGTENKRDELLATGETLEPVDMGTRGGPVVALAAGLWHNCALFDQGKVKCWGDGSTGRLGYGSRDNIGDDPGEMGDDLPFVDLGDHVSIGLGLDGGRSCARLDDDTVRCWGAVGGEAGGYRPGATPGTMGDALDPVATAEELVGREQ
jgi:hypothetical protein